MKNADLFIGSLFCLLLSHAAQAQSVQNVVSEFDGEKVSISYDLNYTSPDQKFLVNLFCSYNGFQKPLLLVSGDVGVDVLPGNQKKMTWDVKNELPPYFNDELTFKVKAILIETPITKAEQPAETTIPDNVVTYKFLPFKTSEYKKGSRLNLEWEGGESTNKIKLDLMKGGVVKKTFPAISNNNSFTWNIPANNKPGNYTFKLSDVANPTVHTFSQTFKIKPKIPLMAKIGVPVLIGVLVGVLAGGGGGAEDPVDSGLSDLPGPISPGG